MKEVKTMAFDTEILEKLTTTLADDVELYNKIINHEQENDLQIEEIKSQSENLKSKLSELEEKNHQYLTQISNLLSKIPVGKTETPQSVEQKIEEIKNRPWVK